ncbi:hypothetical protein D1007_05485 [Hordeum vulgare]|nr:hypothetical protein D1007_05485 [Hordeum vulgare]
MQRSTSCYATWIAKPVASGRSSGCCEAARVTLREISAVLVDEPIDAAETIYTALLDAVSRGMDSRLIGPAANIVDRLFNWPGPLAGAIDVAGALVGELRVVAPRLAPRS